MKRVIIVSIISSVLLSLAGYSRTIDRIGKEWFIVQMDTTFGFDPYYYALSIEDIDKTNQILETIIDDLDMSNINIDHYYRQYVGMMSEKGIIVSIQFLPKTEINNLNRATKKFQSNEQREERDLCQIDLSKEWIEIHSRDNGVWNIKINISIGKVESVNMNDITTDVCSNSQEVQGASTNGLYRTSSSSDNDKVQTIPSVTITSPQVNTMIEFAISHAQEYYPQCCNLVVSPKDYSIVITSYNQNNTAYFNVSFLTEEYLNKMGPFMGYTTYNNYTIYCDTGSYFVKDEKSKSLTIEQIDYTESNSRIIDFVSYRFKLSNDSICWLNAPVAMSDN